MTASGDPEDEHSNSENPMFDWERSVHGDVKEASPTGGTLETAVMFKAFWDIEHPQFCPEVHHKSVTHDVMRGRCNYQTGG